MGHQRESVQVASGPAFLFAPDEGLRNPKPDGSADSPQPGNNWRSGLPFPLEDEWAGT